MLWSCHWRLSNDTFLDIRFHDHDEEGMTRGLPPSGGGSSWNRDELRMNKRAKRAAWVGVKFMSIWFDKKLLTSRDDKFWIKAMREIVLEAPNVEICILFAAAVAGGGGGELNSFPVKALAALLQGIPKVRKLDLRCLTLSGEQEDIQEFQCLLKTHCLCLEEIYYFGSEGGGVARQARTGLLFQQNKDNVSIAAEANSLLSKTHMKRMKRIHLSGLGMSLTRSNQQCLDRVALAKTLEYLHLDILHQSDVFGSLTRLVQSCKKLVHFSLKISPCNDNNDNTHAVVGSSTTKTKKDLAGSMVSLTKALSLTRVFILELKVHSSLMSQAWLRPWVDLFQYNYSCQQFQVSVFGKTSSSSEEEPAIDKDIQTLVQLNALRRTGLLTHFQPHTARPSEWSDLLACLGADHANLSSEDILSGVYLSLRQHVGLLLGVDWSIVSQHPIWRYPPRREDIRELKQTHNKREATYTRCLIRLASKERSASVLWSELAIAKQRFVDNNGGAGAGVGGTRGEKDEYAIWVDELALDYADRAENMETLTKVKESLDRNVEGFLFQE